MANKKVYFSIYFIIFGVDAIVNIGAFILGIGLALTGRFVFDGALLESDWLGVTRIDRRGALEDLILVFTWGLKD